MTNSLKKVRVAVLAVDGFEQVEITLPVAALKRAGADVRIISLRPGQIRGMNFIWPAGKLPVDDLINDARVEDYGALLLPGGFVNPDLLRQSEKARAFVRGFSESGRPIATICHGPAVLISAGVVRGRRLASWPGIQDDVRNAGGEWVDEKVVRDGSWVSSRSPLDMPAFIPAMIELFAEAPKIESSLPRRWRPAAVAAKAFSLAAVPLALTLVSKGVAASGIRIGGKRRAQSPSALWIVPAALAVMGVRRLVGKLAAGKRLRLPSAVSKGYGRASSPLGDLATGPGQPAGVTPQGTPPQPA